MTTVTRGASLTIPLRGNYRTLSWQELVIREWGAEWGQPDVAYEFTGGRTANSTDQYHQGVYNPTNP